MGTKMDGQQPKKFNILLIGDYCTDIYQFGTIDRLSPEAPVPIFVPSHKEERKGMAGNVHSNLIKLECDVTILCGTSSKKTRLVDSRSRQQLLRMDEDVDSIPIVNVDSTGYDAIVISDYGKGVVSYELIEKLIQTKIPLFIDTKKTDLERMQGAWVKINELEYSKIKSECTGLIITRGSKGAEIKHHNYFSPTKKVEVVDVTGAGDTFLSALTYQYLVTNDIKKAVDFANVASSITVQHFGVYAPSLKEIHENS